MWTMIQTKSVFFNGKLVWTGLKSTTPEVVKKSNQLNWALNKHFVSIL